MEILNIKINLFKTFIYILLSYLLINKFVNLINYINLDNFRIYLVFISLSL